MCATLLLPLYITTAAELAHVSRGENVQVFLVTAGALPQDVLISVCAVGGTPSARPVEGPGLRRCTGQCAAITIPTCDSCF